MIATLDEVLAAEIAPGIAHAICRELHGSAGYCVNCLSKARTIYAPLVSTGNLAPVVAEWLRSEDVREVAARASAIHDNYDGCFEREDAEDESDSDAEDREWWRGQAAAALDAVAGLRGGEA